MDRWDLVEQAFWDGTFDAPITTRRKVLTGLGAGLGLAAGGAANLVGNKKRAIWSEKNTDWSKADPWADNAKKYARLAELGKSRESAGPNTSGAIAPREAARSPAARVAPSVHKSATPHKPKMSGGGMSRRGFLGGQRGGDTALDAPKQLSTRYRKGPIYHGLGVVTQGNLRKREGARSDIGGHEAKIESAEHKALNKYVPLI